MSGESQQLPESAPDPSVLTTEAIVRAVHAERDWTLAQLAVLEERLRGIDRATELLSDTVTRTPTEIQQQIGHLKELMAVSFDAVAQKFTDRDVAVSAALAAQKETAAASDVANAKATDKSEQVTKETIGQLGELIRTTTDGLAAKIEDVKARVGSIELMVNGIIQSRSGGQESRTEARNQNAALVAGITVVVTVLVAAVTIALSLR